ncbi:glycosyltransferase family 2 protein [Candidatus Gottesmanbacteria bacterium]|nr:glycosyltransferase family 2 protein [Candidatus Gottesmanbacteria bacterium]
MKISAIILAKNEAARIGKCLESVSWADERIVIDNGSTDDTAKIAKRLGARVINSSEKSFAERRNLGLKESKGDWVLYVDADEIVTPELAKEIQTLKQPAAGYFIRRKNFYLGHLWPFTENILRLFKKSALKNWYGDLHESPNVEGQIGQLKNPLLHYTHRTLEEMVTKTNEWSETEAILRLASGHPPVVAWRLFRVMTTAFFDSYIKQSGWRAGTVGLIESIYQAFSMFLTYAKLWELQNKKQ